LSARPLLIRRLPCVACEIEDKPQPMPTEEHHLNLGGLAGQKRRGDDYSIPLCRWHHQGHRPMGMSTDVMVHLYGPSLKDSRQFRLSYGSDDALLAHANFLLTTLEPASA
jgi:hypothetical protein